MANLAMSLCADLAALEVLVIAAAGALLARKLGARTAQSDRACVDGRPLPNVLPSGRDL